MSPALISYHTDHSSFFSLFICNLPSQLWLPPSINHLLQFYYICLVIKELLSSITGFFFFRLYLFIFEHRGREGEREGEKHQCVVASLMPPAGDLAHNPGMCLYWQLNQ